MNLLGKYAFDFWWRDRRDMRWDDLQPSEQDAWNKMAVHVVSGFLYSAFTWVFSFDKKFRPSGMADRRPFEVEQAIFNRRFASRSLVVVKEFAVAAPCATSVREIASQTGVSSSEISRLQKSFREYHARGFTHDEKTRSLGVKF